MFKDLFSNRLFIGALAIFIFCVGGSLLYMQHVTQKGEKERAETQERIKQWQARQQQPTAEAPQTTEVPVMEQPAEAPVVETPQGGHTHADGTWHEGAHEAPVEHPSTAQMSQDDIKELNNQLKTEGFKPENLSEKQLLHLSRVGLHWDYLSPKQQDKAERNFYAKDGLNPPPKGYTYLLQAAGVPVLDENGNAIIYEIGNSSVQKSFGGYLDVEK